MATMLIAASKGGQVAMDFLREYLMPVHHGLQFRRGDIAVAWNPMPGVRIDPKIQFGAPCIDGTRVQTEVIWSFHQAGDPIQRLAEMYRIERGQIEAALAWERTLAEAA